MARQINRLTAVAVKSISARGRYADGAGLYLAVDKAGGRRWVFLFRDRRSKKLREMGLGGVGTVSLAAARRAAADARAVVRDGGDLILKRSKSNPEVPTFRAVANAYIETMAGSWRNEKHRAQWEMTLRVYCAPFNELPVSAVQTEDILRVLEPIWTRIPETASRVRGRLEKILDAAKAKRFRDGENPARWRGHLDHLLPPRRTLTRGHHAAMKIEDVPGFIKLLREQPSVAALGLEFLILTAARTGEVLGMTSDEVDLKQRVWVVPADRMKAGKVHRVPLCDRAFEIVNYVGGPASSGYLFPGMHAGRPLSQMAFIAVMKRKGVRGATPHGFRSSFRDWCGEKTHFAREVAEAALAHSIPNKVEAAYRRGDALEKRRELMDAWASYCDEGRMG